MNERREPDDKNTIGILTPRGRRSDRSRAIRSVTWGLFLVALGIAFLLERFGMFPFHGIGELWPLIFFVMAITHIAEGRWPAAVSFTVLGLVFMAINFGWMGLNYRNGWPLFLIAAGLGMVTRSMLGDRRRDQEEEASHE